MGPLHKLQSFFSASEVDVNNNNNNNRSKKMGFKGKGNKSQFASEIDFFSPGDGIQAKTYIWSTLKSSKRAKGKEFNIFIPS